MAEAFACTDADRIRDVTPGAEGCEDRPRDGGTWGDLRMCLTCGHVGCCDSSANRHATAHFDDGASDRALDRAGESWPPVRRRRGRGLTGPGPGGAQRPERRCVPRR